MAIVWPPRRRKTRSPAWTWGSSRSRTSCERRIDQDGSTVKCLAEPVEGIRGLRREVFPLDQIADVIVDESSSSDGGSTYRVSLMLADQRRIPWTSYYTSGDASKRAVVNLVREFPRLGPSPALGAGAPTVKTEGEVRRSRVGLALMGVFSSIFLAVDRSGLSGLARDDARAAYRARIS